MTRVGMYLAYGGNFLRRRWCEDDGYVCRD